MIMYLHGFNSSPQSHKAQVLHDYLAGQGLGSEYACPALPPLASDAVRVIEAQIAGKDASFVGSSLGGFYATYLAEKHGARAVLINPAIDPQVGLRAYLGPQKNLHTGEPYELTESHLREWGRLYVPRITPARYLLLVETGDEVLDYRREWSVTPARSRSWGRAVTQPHQLSAPSDAHRRFLPREALMQVLYEEEGDLKVGAVLAQAPASFQGESPHGRRSKVKAASVLLSFERPGGAELLSEAQKFADGLDVD